MNIIANHSCRLCGSQNLPILIDLGPQPIAHRFLEKPEEEFKHPLTLHYCEKCGLGQILNPVPPEILYKGYNYCFSEWKPEPHRETELDLICEHKQNSKIFEIGCNDGLFLEQLKLRGQAVCVGLEPNSFAKNFATEKRGLHVYETFLNEAACKEIVANFGKFDLVIARQVIEHIPDIRLFFRCLDILLNYDGMVFIDVPDVGPGLEVGDCTIAWEEHVNYFTDNVLDHLLDRHGFTPVEKRKFNYSGGTLALLARRKSHLESFTPSRDYLPYSRSFSERVETYGSRLRNAIIGSRASFDQIVIYGVGCRACALVNGHKLENLIDFAVDDQTERQGKLMPGSKLEIKSAEMLQKKGLKFLVILAVNQENEEKVINKCKLSCVDSKLTFLHVLGPNNIDRELDFFLKYEQFSC